MDATIEYAVDADLAFLAERSSEKSPEVLRRKIQAGEVIVARLGGEVVAWMTYTLLYDVVPFINILYILQEHRRRGLGTRLVRFLESEVSKAGFRRVMTSSLSNEQGQHFWRKMGYKDVGGVLLADEPLEVFFRKELNS
jgi:GNAT superfamily N-acetyltransferase